MAEDQGEPRRRALARRALGSTLFYFGRFEAAAEQLFEGIAIDQAAEGSDDDPAFLAVYAERAGVVCRTNLAMSLWYLGYPDQALRTVEEGLALADQLAHAHSVAFAKVQVAMIRNCRRDFTEAVSWADATVEVSREHGLPQWLAMGVMYRGFALAGLGRWRRGLELIREGFWHGMQSAPLFWTLNGLVTSQRPTCKPANSTRRSPPLTRRRRWRRPARPFARPNS